MVCTPSSSLRAVRIGMRGCAVALAVSAPLHAIAQSSSATAATPSQATSTTTTTAERNEPGTRRIVIEDDSTRIEELHVRGEAQRVVVRPKRVNMPEWEIRPDSPGRSSPGETRLPRDTANTRMWRVLTF